MWRFSPQYGTTGPRLSVGSTMRPCPASNSDKPIGSAESLSNALWTWVGEARQQASKAPGIGYGAHVSGSYRCIAEDRGSGSTVHAVPDVLAVYVAQCDAKNQNFQYRHAKSMLASYARNVGNEWLTAMVKKAPNMHAERKRERLIVEPKELRQNMRPMEKNGFGFLTQHVWNLACLSTRPKEYCQADPSTPTELVWMDDAVQVKAGKTNAARRYIPRFHGVSLPAIRCALRRVGLVASHRGRKAISSSMRSTHCARNSLALATGNFSDMICAARG